MYNKLSVTDQVMDHVCNALYAHAQSDDVEWVVVPAMGPNGEICHFVTLIMPSSILGQSIQAGGVVVGGIPSGEEIVQLVQRALDSCREARSRRLSEELAAAGANRAELIVP